MGCFLWFLMAIGAGQTATQFALEGSKRTARIFVVFAYVTLIIGFWKLWHWYWPG